MFILRICLFLEFQAPDLNVLEVQDSYVTLTWKPLGIGDSYNLKMYNGTASLIRDFDIKAAGNSPDDKAIVFTFSNLFADQHYHVEMTAITKDGIRSSSNKIFFDTRKGKFKQTASVAELNENNFSYNEFASRNYIFSNITKKLLLKILVLCDIYCVLFGDLLSAA